MKTLHPLVLSAAFGIFGAVGLRGQADPRAAEWDSVGRILQSPATATGGYHRFNFPRRDLTLRIGDVTVAPALALGSWAGFAGEPADATMMGDLVLTADEVPHVLAEMSQEHLDVTAVHNHLVGESPTITYLHYHGQGSALDLAARLDRVLHVTATPRPVSAGSPAAVTIDTAMVFRALGQPGRAQGNVAQVGMVLVPGAVTMDGRTMNPAMAYGSPINIQQVSPQRVVATGDFAVPGPKVSALLNALATHGIAATAVHMHMIDETPKVYFIHYWADGPLPAVLAGLRAAIDAAR